MKNKKSKISIDIHTGPIVIGVGVVILIILSILAFNFLWYYFKAGFIWFLSLIAMLITRKTDSWKMGVECFYFLTFVYAYTFGIVFTIPLYILCMLIVIKLRPDEFNGAVTHMIVLTGLTLTARHLVGIYGTSISHSTFIFLGIGSILFWDTIRGFIAKKMAPIPWIKLFVSEFIGLTVNYFYFTTFGYAFFKYVLTL